jgi:hypothetical protein
MTYLAERQLRGVVPLMEDKTDASKVHQQQESG